MFEGLKASSEKKKRKERKFEFCFRHEIMFVKESNCVAGCFINVNMNHFCFLRMYVNRVINTMNILYFV